MQELRLVLIVVGALAIAALLFHGLWTSRKEGRARFGDKPFSGDDADDLATEHAYIPEDDFEIIKKEPKAPAFAAERSFAGDPLDDHVESDMPVSAENTQDDEVPSIRLEDDDIAEEPAELFVMADDDVEIITKPRQLDPVVQDSGEESPQDNEDQTEAEPEEDELQVIVLHVHCAGEEPFVGTRLFDSMQQNGLIYGEMDIYHRHADLSGNGKVLFSVANMMQPGTLQHDDPETFTTKGISFFMTLPCYGDAEQNFKLMLKIAQQIADDMSGHVLDDQRNFMTPDKLESYRRQIREFKATQHS
ncbi:cell division protein ZipA [Vibrio sp. HA2012]|uniref:cell division protein ZipA n=1 Tax=Vibrio sp. HA2012 TaxID=1971595 RepID=UPI000C2CC2BB|nr:cell division protein ZipA [Vibrio sp. HA2012]PJC85507.1 cell division protein ZipA [Vibrio sp. HA2012]